MKIKCYILYHLLFVRSFLPSPGDSVVLLIVSTFLTSLALSVLFHRQAVFIAILVQTGVIKQKQSWVVYDVDDVANALQVS